MDGHDHQPSQGWTRRSVLRALGLAGAATAVSPAVLGQLTTPARASSHGAFSTEDVVVESFDGTDIATTLYLPAADGPHPSILMTHGWGSNRAANHPLVSFYAANGYVVLSYDSRGFGESGGLVTSTGPNEVGDARALIDWLADHEAVETDDAGDPSVGMDGGSYGGGIQLRTAAEDDRLDAIVPRITWHDLPAAYAPNDVFKIAWANALSLAGQSGNIHPDLVEIGEGLQEAGGMTEAFREFYRPRSPVSYIDEIDTPTLIVHSWYDRLFPLDQALANFRGIHDRGVESALVVQDASGHNLGGSPPATPTEQAFVANATLSWLDAHVAGEGDHGLPPVSLYDDASDSFISAETFPPADASPRTLDHPIRGNVRVRNLPADRPDEELTSFDFPVDERTEVVGTPELRATVAPTGRGTARLAFALQHVTDGGTTTIKTQVTPVAVEERTHLELELFPIHRVFEPGDVLRLAVATRDEHVDDVSISPFISDTGLYVDSDEKTGAAILDTPAHPATLTVPTR